MLDIAETLDPLLDARARHVEQAELGLEDDEIDEYTAETTLQLIFFDGEEAFVSWTATDSIYGARYVPSLFLLPRSYVSPTFLFPT
jgi:glutaminyl-peptide cyclotransferase